MGVRCKRIGGGLQLFRDVFVSHGPFRSGRTIKATTPVIIRPHRYTRRREPSKTVPCSISKRRLIERTPPVNNYNRSLSVTGDNSITHRFDAHFHININPISFLINSHKTLPKPDNTPATYHTHLVYLAFLRPIKNKTTTPIDPDDISGRENVQMSPFKRHSMFF